MKKYFGNVKHKAKEYWLKYLHSPMKKMSNGAYQIAKVITSPHKDNWRRKSGKKGKGD